MVVEEDAGDRADQSDGDRNYEDGFQAAGEHQCGCAGEDEQGGDEQGPGEADAEDDHQSDERHQQIMDEAGADS